MYFTRQPPTQPFIPPYPPSSCRLPVIPRLHILFHNSPYISVVTVQLLIAAISRRPSANPEVARRRTLQGAAQRMKQLEVPQC